MNDRIERNAIVVAALAGMAMAVAGWFAYHVSGAEVLLLDGNFSFIGVLATLLALWISRVKATVSETYPFGKFVYEPTYALLIALLTLGVIVVALAGNATKIAGYLQGGRYPAVDTSVIVVYTAVMTVLCFGLAAFFRRSNRRLGGGSAILGAYTLQYAIDGVLSAGAGGALMLFGLVSPDGTFGFLAQIGDAVIVVLLCLLVMYQPVRLARNSYTELSGGALDDPVAVDRMRAIVSAGMEPGDIADLFVSKTGSGYLVVAFVRAEFFGTRDPRELRGIGRRATRELEEEFGYVTFALTLADGAVPAMAGGGDARGHGFRAAPAARGGEG